MDRQTIDDYIQQIQLNMDKFIQFTHQCLHECQISLEMAEQEKRQLEDDNRSLRDQINSLEKQLQTVYKPQGIEQENTSVEPTF